MGAMVVLQFFWFIPITALASLLSYSEIKKTMPWLAQMIESNERLAAIVQNSLPSVAMITLNATLPFLLEGMRLRPSESRGKLTTVSFHSLDSHSSATREELDRVLGDEEVSCLLCSFIGILNHGATDTSSSCS